MSVAVAVLLWLAAGYRLVVLRRHPNFLNTMYGLTFVLVAAAVTAKALEQEINQSLGPHIGDLVKHLLIVGMGAAIQLYILAVDVGRPPRRSVLIRVGVAALIAAGMIATFAAAPLHVLGGAADDLAVARLGEMQVYRVLFNGYLVYVLVENIRLYRRFANAPGDDGRSVNLRLVGWGSAAGLVYAGSRVLSVLSAALTGQPLTTLETVGSVAALVGATCVAAAVFSPRLVPWFQDRRAARRGIRRLGPLWADLTADYPAVVLGSTGALSFRGAEFAFDRRLVETSECLRLVHLPDAARSLVLAASKPTAALATQLHRERAGWTTADGPTPMELLPPPRSRADEVATLLELADHYAAAAPDHSALPAAHR